MLPPATCATALSAGADAKVVDDQAREEAREAVRRREAHVERHLELLLTLVRLVGDRSEKEHERRHLAALVAREVSALRLMKAVRPPPVK